ncbi:MAG TPA: pentapeptide repeat-containing protein, partial [Phormidium sp.]
MRVSEVLQLYAEGRRDFHRKNLRSLSFKGKDLSGADFSEADIRGANFSKANLTGAKFVGAKAGLPKRWVITLLFCCLVLLVISSFLTVFFGVFVVYITSPKPEEAVLGWVALVAFLGFGFLSFYRGINASASASAFAIAIAIASASASILLYSYLGWRAIKGDPRDAWIRTIAIAFAATGGTNFRYANLTDTDFTKATLKNSDFRDAILTRTCFKGTKKLDFARPGKTYLNIPQVRDLVIKGQGQDKNFERLNLQGINLRGANLADANFISADFSNANLQDADLSRAKLVQTQLDKTDFTGATLTGAYIEDWGITRGTKFDGVRCEYVYMRLPTKYNPDPFRKPDNNEEFFADGEFGDFIKPIVDTLDLYHNQNVDPRAIAIAFKQLAENHPEAELEIVAIE